jgi:GTP-binding protein HflX
MIEKEKVILVGVNTQQQVNFEDAMEELKNLAEACELEVAGRVEQNLKVPHSAYYIGSGKVKEVIALMEDTGAEIIIFNNELSPSQLRNLEKELHCEILDRTALILEIFARRAKTREAKMQVESAQLKYMLPRLAGLRSALGRQGGGSGLRNRGAGEKKIELDRRKIEEKITELDKELNRIKSERQTQSKKRITTELPRVALAGYTNAGKSTLMNALIERYQKSEEKKVFEKDMLFATLETSVRNIRLEDNKTFLLSDTVGFVSDLPHDLVKAFRSTLQEIIEADLLIHVIDISNPHYKEQLEVTADTLKQIGAEHLPVIYAYNKVDLLDSDVIPEVEEEGLFIAAKKNIGIDELIGLISQKIFAHYVICEMLIPYDRGEIVAYLNENASVKSVSYEEKGTLLRLECRQSDYKRYEQFLKSC